MTWLGNVINSAKNNIKGNNSSPNQLVEERFLRQPNIQSLQSNNALTDDYYVDEDHDGIDDRFEPRSKGFKPGQNISGIKKHPNPKEFKPFSFKGKYKDYNLSFDKKGKFVPTATYPLPPVSHQQKLLDRNRRMRNKDNKFL
jgi:hypothetical protein